MRKNILVLLIVINLAGTIFGFYSYQPQIKDKNMIEWFLIADCPVAVLLFTCCLFLMILNRRVPGLLADFAFIYTIKNSLMTILIFLLYHNSFAASFSILASSAHLFMILESSLLIPLLSNKPHSLILLVLLDFSDFFMGTLYSLPDTSHLKTIFFTVILLNFGLYSLKNKLINNKNNFSFKWMKFSG